MKRVCPECGNNFITAYRKIVFCDDEVNRSATFPVLTYVCKGCGFSVIPKSAADMVHDYIGGL